MLIQNDVETTIRRLQTFLTPSSWLFILLVGYGALIGLTRLGVFLPRHFRLMMKGLDLLLAGKPLEAEKCYRTALDQGAKVHKSDRVHLLVCLADALTDQKRYEEALQLLSQALQLGDPTGSGQSSMCDVLLYLHQSPENAIEMADRAMQLHLRAESTQAFGTRWTAVYRDLYEAKTCARKAQALLRLDRKTESRQAMDQALKIAETSKTELQQTKPVTSFTQRLILGKRLRRQKELAISVTHWQIGLALLALQDTVRAAEHFRVVRDADRMGKYRGLAQKQLDRLGFAEN